MFDCAFEINTASKIKITFSWIVIENVIKRAPVPGVLEKKLLVHQIRYFEKHCSTVQHFIKLLTLAIIGAAERLVPYSRILICSFKMARFY